MPRSLKKSLGLNFAGRVLAGAVGLVATPFYLHLLGRENFGLIGFGLLLQIVLGFLGAGLADAANREAASVERNGAVAVAEKLAMLVRLAWLTGLGLGGLLAMFSYWLARHWLTLDSVNPDTATLAIRLMAVLIALQVPVDLYAGTFLGSRRPLAANLVLVGNVAGRAVVSIGAMIFIAPTIEVFFVAQVVVSLAAAIIAHATFRRAIFAHGVPNSRMTWSGVRASFRFSAGMTGVALTSMLLGQADRLVLSRTLRLDEFGIYALAVTLANSLYFLIGPVQSSYYPEFARCNAPAQGRELSGLYHQACQRMAVLVLPAGAVLVFFSRDILELWTSNADVAEHAALVVSLLVLVRMIGALNTIPYSLQFAHGWFSLVLRSNLAAIVLLLPALYYFAFRWGGVGAASGYLLIALPFLGVIVWRMHRRLLPGELGRWIWSDTLPTLILTLLLVGTWKWAQPVGLSRPNLFLWIAIAGISTFGVVVVANPTLRAQVRKLANRLRMFLVSA